MNENEEFQNEMDKAIAFATKCHLGQYRKHSGLPYIVHPFAVMNKLAEWGVTDLITLKAALCHDILEDCRDVGVGRFIEQMGQETFDIVSELTFIPDNSKPAKEQKTEYLSSFKDKSLKALLIKMADRICNTKDFKAPFNPVDVRNYAWKYWVKADVLFDTFNDRFDEVVDQWHESLAFAIQQEIDSMNA